jgi:arylsulfatase A-like enzyme
MKEKRDKPLFLAVGLFRPHIPFEVSQKWFDLYPIEQVRVPEHLINDLKDARPHGRMGWHKWVTENKQWKHLMRGYLASISYVDHQVGRLLDALDSSSKRENTIVVLWTDHGFHIGEKENWEKFALWDQTTRVPLFIHAPGVSKDGVKTRHPVTLTDLYPTLCDLASLPVPDQCDGKSLVPQLKNPDKKKKSLSLTSFQFWGDSAPAHAVSDHRYRLIQYPDGFEELYDLKKDTHEFHNLSEDPNFSKIKNRLSLGIPKETAALVGIPKSSPYNLTRHSK